MPTFFTRTRAIALTLLALLVVAPTAAAAPTATFQSFVEGVNPQYQHAAGNVMWVNAGAAASGSFMVNVHATDPVDGINRVDFPMLGAGWAPAGASDTTGPSPYQVMYSWSAGAAQPGVVNAIAFSNIGATMSVPFEVRADLIAPVGGSISYPNGFTNATSIPIVSTASTDSESGADTTQLQRRSATLTAATCGGFGTWANVGPVNPAASWPDTTTASGSCYEYRLVTTDRVGNTTFVTSPSVVKVDRVLPTGTINAVPVGPISSSATLGGTATDIDSGVGHVDVTYTGPAASSGSICLSPPSPETWSCTWNTSALTPGLYTILLDVYDNAGNPSTTITRVIQVDAPAVVPVTVDTGAGVEVEEGGASTTFDVVLDSIPASNVTISFASDSQVIVGLPSVTFTPANWNVPQQVLVSAVDDAVDEADPHDGEVTFTSASADPAFDALAIAPVIYDVADDDTAGVAISAGPVLNVAEAGATSDTFTASLDSQPAATVTISVASGDGQLGVAPSTLVFTPVNWNVPQVVTVTAVDDAVDESDPHAGIVQLAVSSVDPAYDGLVVADQVAVIADDDIVISGTATAAFASFAEVTGSQYQHASGSTMWFNPAQSGSFTATGTGTATPSLASLTFPALGAGWTPAAPLVDTTSPYSATYAWTSGAVAPGAATFTATGSAGATGNASFTVAADTTPPAGVTVSAQTTVTRDTSAPVTGTNGTDAQSGIGSWRVQRRAAGLAADTCGAWGAWSDIGAANPAGPISDASLADSTCVQYRYVVTDNVGNAATATQDGELKVDRTPPVGSITPITAPLYGTVTITGTAHDATTRLRMVAVIVEDRYSICPSTPVDANGNWSCTWTIGAREVGTANLKVNITDAAGQRTSITQAVTLVKPPSPLGPREEDIDRTPPVVGLARIPLISWSDGVKVKASAYDDRDGTIEIRVEQQSARAHSVKFSPWAESFEESEVTPLEERGETTCFRGVAVDEAGNRAVSDPRCTTLPLDDTDLKASGPWDDINSTTAWLGTHRLATKKGAALWTTVADPTPTLVVTKCKGCGSIKVYHGKKLLGTYSLNAKKTMPRQLVQLPTIAKPTSAPLKLVTVNAKRVMVDALIAAR